MNKIEFYEKKINDIKKDRLNQSRSFQNKLDDFLEKNISKNLDKNKRTVLLFDYNHDYYTSPLKIKSFNIHYEDSINKINATFFINENNKNILKFNVKNYTKKNYIPDLAKNPEFKVKKINIQTESKKSVYEEFCENIKYISNNKQVIFTIINEFEKYLHKDKKNVFKIKRCKQIILLSERSLFFKKYKTIFKNYDVDNLYEFLDKKCKLNNDNKKYKEIKYIKEYYNETNISFNIESIKIFNYKQKNEYYVYEKKIISKDQFLCIISNLLVHENKLIQNFNDLPFKIIKNGCYSCSYEDLSKFINECFLNNNIINF